MHGTGADKVEVAGPLRVRLFTTERFVVRSLNGEHRIFGPPRVTDRVLCFDLGPEDDGFDLETTGEWIVRFEDRTDGKEYLDPTPVEVPFEPPLDYHDELRRIVREELSQQAAEEGHETFEESMDFDVSDDDEIVSPYEFTEMDEEILLDNQGVTGDNNVSRETEESGDDRGTGEGVGDVEEEVQRASGSDGPARGGEGQAGRDNQIPPVVREPRKSGRGVDGVGEG